MIEEIDILKAANVSLYFQRFLGCNAWVDKELSLRGCLDSKAENETWYLKSIITVLATTKDLGHPVFIKIK